jgi:hypothetical protein
MLRATRVPSMGHIVQRLGIRIGRGWVVLFLLALLVAGGFYWVGPERTAPPRLRLLAVAGDSATEDVNLRGERDEDAQSVRFVVPLAVQNVGTRPAQPQRLVLSVPGRFALATPRGRLTGEVTPGVPLRRYVIDVAAPPLEPGARPQRLRGADTLWLEPDLPQYYCTQVGDGVPEFVPAPQYDPRSLSHVRIFYSVDVRGVAERSTGLLTLRLDPRQLQMQPAAMPPSFPTVFEEPEVQAPELGPLLYRGARTSWCGDPEQPLELFSVLWETQAGARFFVLHVGGQPRKHLYDLNGDGVIELETWDADGDGRFEARRQARFDAPGFLLPLPAQRPELALPDTVPPDPAWLELFHRPAAGPFRFALQARVAPASGDTMATGMPSATELGPLPPPDSAWLALFNRLQEGPFRFSRRPVEAVAAADSPTAEPDTTPSDTVTPEPRPPARPRPLGTPVPIPRRDTIPR